MTAQTLSIAQHKFTDCQKRSLADIEEFLEDNERQEYTLKGFAGTGKTTLIIEIIRDYLSYNDKLDLAVCAPTNKAAQVLNQKLKADRIPVCATTVHSMLGMLPRIDYKTGREYFYPSKASPYITRFEYEKTKQIRFNCSLILIDEASMIGEELYQHLKDALGNSPDTKIIYIGDSAQLPPVNEPDSQVFKFDGICMTEVVRHGDEILELATALRENLEHDEPISTCESPLGTTVHLLRSRKQWRQKMLDAFADFGTENPDKVRTVVWTNSMRVYLNNLIRRSIIPNYEEKFVVGEVLVAIKPVIRKAKKGEMVKDEYGRTVKAFDKIIVANTEEVVVQEVELIELTFEPKAEINKSDKRNYTYHFHKIRLEGKEDEILVISDSDKERYKRHQNLLKKNALKLPEDERKEAWIDYFTLRDFNADVDYAYCLTAHKSQGSTFETVFVDASNIAKNQDVVERNKCLYVACTRASTELVILLP